MNPAGRQDLGVSRCCLSFSSRWRTAVRSPPRGGCNLVTGNGWFLGGPGVRAKCQRAQRAPAGAGVPEVACPTLHRVGRLKGWRLAAEVVPGFDVL